MIQRTINSYCYTSMYQVGHTREYTHSESRTKYLVRTCVLGVSIHEYSIIHSQYISGIEGWNTAAQQLFSVCLHTHVQAALSHATIGFIRNEQL